AHERYILLAIDLVRDGRRHADSSGPLFEELLTLVCAIRHEAPVRDHVEDKIPAGGHGSASNSAAAIGTPDQRVLYRIPSLQAAANAVRSRRADGRRLDLARLSARA